MLNEREAKYERQQASKLPFRLGVALLVILVVAYFSMDNYRENRLVDQVGCLPLTHGWELGRAGRLIDRCAG